MQKDELLNKIRQIKKGSYVSVTKESNLDKGIRKVSRLVVRLGVNYSKMKASEGKEVGKLPWGNWVEGYENLLIEHKGNTYLRVSNSYTKGNKSEYYLGKKKITKEIANYLLDGKLAKNVESPVYNINISDIKYLGK